MLFQWKACCVLHGYIPLLWWFWHSDFPINNHPLLGQVADFNYFHLCRCLIPFLKFNTHILVVPLFYIFVFHAGIDFITMIIHIIFNLMGSSYYSLCYFFLPVSVLSSKDSFTHVFKSDWENPSPGKILLICICAVRDLTFVG